MDLGRHTNVTDLGMRIARLNGDWLQGMTAGRRRRRRSGGKVHQPGGWTTTSASLVRNQ